MSHCKSSKKRIDVRCFILNLMSAGIGRYRRLRREEAFMLFHSLTNKSGEPFVPVMSMVVIYNA